LTKSTEGKQNATAYSREIYWLSFNVPHQSE